MHETIPKLRAEALAWLPDAATAYLATSEGGQPRVRPVAILWHNGYVWFSSGTANGKTQQVARHPSVELCVPIERGDRTGYVRVAGTAKIVADPDLRAAYSERMPFFTAFWSGPEDPRYTLIRVVPSEISYLRPEDDHHETGGKVGQRARRLQGQRMMENHLRH